MLKELHIRNYALFENVCVQLGPRFNVFTGETGAGKSLLVGAIGLILGHKGDSAFVRKGCSEAEVIGLLSIEAKNREANDWLKSYEIPLESEIPNEASELTVRRILKDNGKNSCYIQHIPMARNKLAEFMALLFDLHGQHQNQSLYHSRQQLRLLDNYAQLNSRVEQFGKTFQELNQKKKELADAELMAGKEQEQIAYLRKAIEEMEELKPQENEDQNLSEQIELLSNAESLLQQFDQFIKVGREALILLDRSQSQLTSLAKKLGSVAELLPRLQSAYIEIEDILDSCKEEKNKLQVNPEQLQQLDQRLSKLILLSRKYGNSSLNEAVQFGREAANKLTSLENSGDFIVQQKEQLQTWEKQLMQEAQFLSQQRKKYAAMLSQRIEENLHNLGMGQAKFQIELSHRSNENGHILCQSYGIDKARFMLAANSGENFHEVQQVASGGEISRIMLAIKSEPAQRAGNSSIESIIFDEIDTGIGGETGSKLAQHIHQLSQHKQILCVTHLASIAASASTHIKIDKLYDTNNTKISIYELTPEKRPAELARMLSGDTKNPVSLAHAEQLLNRYL